MVRRRLWCAHLAGAAVGIPLYLALGPGLAQRLLFYAFGLGALGAVLVGTILNRPPLRQPWFAFAGGLLLFVLGDIAFDAVEATGPSVADALYLSGYVLLVLGAVQFVRRRTPDGDAVSVLDGLMVALGVGALSWTVLLGPSAAASDLGLVARLVPLSYPALDLLLLAILVRLVLGGGVRNRAFVLLALGTLALIATDIVYGALEVAGQYHPGDVIDVGWMFSYALWGAAALHPSMRTLAAPATTPERPRTRGLIVVLGLASCAAPVTLIVESTRRANVDVRPLAASSILLFGLVMARVGLLTRRVEAAARRQAQLADLASALVQAADADAVVRIGIDAATRLSGRGAEIVAGHDPRGYPIEIDGKVRATLLLDGTDPSGTAALLCSQLGLAFSSAAAMEERSSRLFRAVVQSSANLVTLLDAGGRVAYASPAIEGVMGIAPEQLLGAQYDQWIHDEDLPNLRQQFLTLVDGGLGASATVECRLAHADGTWRTIDAVITNLLADPDVRAVVVNARDVTVRRQLEAELNRQAFSDTLTGLANRALLTDRVGHALARTERGAEPLAVLFVDLDDFKVVNDGLGHPVGDRLLVGVAERLRAATRPGDTVARLGGDEFCVLLEAGPMPATAQAVADRVAAYLEEPFVIDGEELVVGASIGIAFGVNGANQPEDLLRNADLAMYIAKRNGKRRSQIFEPAMYEEAARRVELAADLRRGIEQDQLEVFYQPIVATDTGRTIGVEALVRWRHPVRGLVSPIEFIPLAESSGLIVALGQDVLLGACRDAATWIHAGLVDDDFHVSVNLSPRQLLDESLVEHVRAALGASGLPASALVLEVTESALIEDLETSVIRLHALKQLGIQLAIDDFGTGYSSLSYLHTLPVDLVKIDKSFIDRLSHDDEEGRVVVQTIVDLAHALGLALTAEGVEAPDQLDVLQLGCDTVQGYLFARPMPADELLGALLAASPEGQVEREREAAHATTGLLEL